MRTCRTGWLTDTGIRRYYGGNDAEELSTAPDRPKIAVYAGRRAGEVDRGAVETQTARVKWSLAGGRLDSRPRSGTMGGGKRPRAGR
jgi:hypothetical protein